MADSAPTTSWEDFFAEDGTPLDSNVTDSGGSSNIFNGFLSNLPTLLDTGLKTYGAITNAQTAKQAQKTQAALAAQQAKNSGTTASNLPKIIIGVAVVAVVGLIGFLIFRKKS